jgi:hypothetical protein
MSAIHYKSRNTKFRLTPNRAINAAAEIEMILEATGADGLGTAIISRLTDTVGWLQGEVATQIQRVMDENKAAAASTKKVEVVWPSVDDVAKSTAAQLKELAVVLSVDLSGVKASKAARLAAIEAARPVVAKAPKAKAEKADKAA